MSHRPPATGDGKHTSKDAKRSDSKSGWAENVDRLLDASPVVVKALRSAFIKYQDPRSSSIPPKSLLPALQLFFQRALEGMSPTASKLFHRPVTRDDLEAVAQDDPSLSIDQPADMEEFGMIARKVGRRVLVERGKRLGLFVVGGIVMVHVVKGIAKRLPFVGTAAEIFMSIMPITLVGPAVGVAGAFYSSGV